MHAARRMMIMVGPENRDWDERKAQKGLLTLAGCVLDFARNPKTHTRRVNDARKPTAVNSADQAGKEPGATDQSGRAGGLGGAGASGRGVGEGRPKGGRSEVGARVSAA